MQPDEAAFEIWTTAKRDFIAQVLHVTYQKDRNLAEYSKRLLPSWIDIHGNYVGAQNQPGQAAIMQGSSAAQQTSGPQQISGPQQTFSPQQAFTPEQTFGHQQTFVPQQTFSPQQTFGHHQSFGQQQGVPPQHPVVPQQFPDSRQFPGSQQLPGPQQVPGPYHSPSLQQPVAGTFNYPVDGLDGHHTISVVDETADDSYEQVDVESTGSGGW
jgi:hypothetical protein